MALILTTTILLLVLSFSSIPSVNAQLHERARGPGSVGPLNPDPLCDSLTGAPTYQDCGVAVKHAVQQYVRSDRTKVWDLDGVFEFYDRNVGPQSEDVANSIALPTTTRHVSACKGSCIVLLKQKSQFRQRGWAATDPVKSDKATWNDIIKAAENIFRKCAFREPPVRPTGGRQIFGEFNVLQITLFATWSPQEVIALDYARSGRYSPVPTLDNNGAYDAAWEWPHLEPLSDDDGSSKLDLQNRPSYIFQLRTQEDLDSYCGVAYFFMHSATNFVPTFLQILFGLLEIMGPVLNGMCEPK
ncbi:MAG: hypothetical protein M1836_002505 [Candelina mexicana]|nr:MAG: hypothetical protein M1836_002505 [Candelina mexicana]